MNIYELDKHLEAASLFGSTLNIEQRLRIGLALENLTEDNSNIDEFKFWGRIETASKSYYIIVGYTYSTYEFPHKTFFWGTNPTFEFVKLVETLYQQHQELVNKINKMFTGEPDKILANLEEEGEGNQQKQEANEELKNEGNVQQEEIQDDEGENKVLKKNLTQINRLSVVVRSIQNDCQIVPIGSYKMSPQHSLQLNHTYKSTNLTSSLNLSNWQHFRAPQSAQKRKQIDQQSVIFSQDFLDPIQDDKPVGSWSSQFDVSDAVVSVRNLAWPGYFAYQKLNSDLFGSCYFGDGCKNVDLAFQL